MQSNTEENTQSLPTREELINAPLTQQLNLGIIGDSPEKNEQRFTFAKTLIDEASKLDAPIPLDEFLAKTNTEKSPLLPFLTYNLASSKGSVYDALSSTDFAVELHQHRGQRGYDDGMQFGETEQESITQVGEFGRALRELRAEGTLAETPHHQRAAERWAHHTLSSNTALAEEPKNDIATSISTTRREGAQTLNETLSHPAVAPLVAEHLGLPEDPHTWTADDHGALTWFKQEIGQAALFLVEDADQNNILDLSPVPTHDYLDMVDSEEETQSQKIRAAGFPQPIQTALKTSPASEGSITKAGPSHLQYRSATDYELGR